MTTASIQPFCIQHNINIGCYDGLRVCPTNSTEKNIALYTFKNHFSLISKSNGVSFNKAIGELKINSKVVDNSIFDKHVKSFIRKNTNLKKFDLNQLK